MRLLIVGAGGHAKVVIDAARASGHEVVAAIGDPGVVDHVLGAPVLEDVSADAADGFVVAVGDNESRARLFAEWIDRGMRALGVVHPSAVLADGVRVGAGAFVAAGVIVNADAVIGDDCILNTGCTVDHDCVIREHAHVAPGANLCGAVTVGPGALVGVGACVVPGVTIGANALVGAGGVVISNVPPGLTVCGVPARSLSSSPKEQ